jgi:hypothetical protein
MLQRFVHLEGPQGRIVVARTAPSVVSLALSGRDVAHLVDAVAQEIEPDLAASEPLQLFVDARRTVGASMMMSAAWARWLAGRRDDLGRVDLLTGSGFLQLTGDFVRRFAGLGEKLHVHVDPGTWSRALSRAAARGAVQVHDA